MAEGEEFDIMRSIILKPKKKGFKSDIAVSTTTETLSYDKKDTSEIADVVDSGESSGGVGDSASNNTLSGVDISPTTGWATTWVTPEPSSPKTLTVSTDSDTTPKDADKIPDKIEDSKIEEETPIVVEEKKVERPPPKVPKKNGSKKAKIRELPPLVPEDSLEEDGCPSNWATDGWSGPGGYHTTKLRSITDEYCSIHTEFVKLTDKYDIVQIERLENRDLWDKYLFEGARMARDRPEGTDLNERYLFHGTQVEKSKIASEGLDMRLGKIGYFGRGIYLSDNINKSLQYCASAEDSPHTEVPISYILKCRVLLGDSKVYAPGEKNPDLRREPLRETEKPYFPKYYDSVKGNISGDDEYIVYNNHRVMPEYIITYKRKSTQTDMNTSMTQSLKLPTPAPVASKPKSHTFSVKVERTDQSSGSKESTVPTTSVVGSKIKVFEAKGAEASDITTPWVAHPTWVATSEEKSNEFETDGAKDEFSNEFGQKNDEFRGGMTKEEYSKEFGDAKSKTGMTREEFSKEFGEDAEFKTGMTKEEFSKEFEDHADSAMTDAFSKEFGEAGAVGKPVSWQPEDDEEHERRLEEIRSSMKKKKHRRFKPKKEDPLEPSSDSKAKPTDANDKKDSISASQSIPPDQQAIQIREYLKNQHKKLQLRKANEDSINKVENLMIAYMETYGSLDADTLQLPLGGATGQSAAKDVTQSMSDTPKKDADSTKKSPAVMPTTTPSSVTMTTPSPPISQAMPNPFMPQTTSIPSSIPTPSMPFTLPPLPPLQTRKVKEDPVKEVMDSMIAEFMEVTGMTDRNKAIDYIKKAGNNANDAVYLYYTVNS